jgi:hypothetical protein
MQKDNNFKQYNPPQKWKQNNRLSKKKQTKPKKIKTIKKKKKKKTQQLASVYIIF